MEEILKQDKSKSHKEFEKLLSKDLENRKFKEGEITTGTVEEIGKKFVFIDLGLKSSGAIPIEEFKLTKEMDKIEIGSKVDVLLEKIENRDGEIVVSREKVSQILYEIYFCLALKFLPYLDINFLSISSDILVTIAFLFKMSVRISTASAIFFKGL